MLAAIAATLLPELGTVATGGVAAGDCGSIAVADAYHT